MYYSMCTNQQRTAMASDGLLNPMHLTGRVSFVPTLLAQSPDSGAKRRIHVGEYSGVRMFCARGANSLLGSST